MLNAKKTQANNAVNNKPRTEAPPAPTCVILSALTARRIGALEAELVYFEDKIAAIRAAGGEPDAGTLDLYSRVSNTHRRHCESIGWKRRPRDVTPALNDYVAGLADKPPEAAA